MINALLLIVSPIAAWERILQARLGLVHIFFIHLLPLLALTCWGEAYGLVHWGKWRGEVPRLKHFSAGEAFIFEVAQFLLSLLLVFLGAKLIKSIGETFHGRHSYSQTFTVVAYGLTPLFLARLLDAFTPITPWVSWAVGILFSIGVIYQGLPRIMQPDPPHAFGLYLMSSLLLFIISGLITFVTAWYLQGEFITLEALILRLAARLPF